MEQVTGIGGVFFRAASPSALHEWYTKHLGVPAGQYGAVFEAGDVGATVWNPFPADTTYFGPSGQALMINYRVRDLDAMLDQLRAGGVEVLDNVEALEGVGRFAWGVDPEGNRFELWEPAPE